ncbi:MAG TPA: ribonuclease H-like domain-containing protein [Candidatus Cybelea sp.]|nr:ribonuclease H-like domain-containing protein [Candidatus Cybelea sp.]
MSIHLYKGDLPAGLDLGASIAIDTETMGLNPARDRLCLVQMSAGDGVSHLVQIPKPEMGRHHVAPRLAAVLEDPNVLKIFHFARFDIATLKTYLGVTCRPVYCTKIASKMVRSYTDRHGLKDLCKELLDVELSKQQQSSDWGSPELSEDQLRYAASDVLYLHRLKEKLDPLLAREGRTALAAACFEFLPTRSELDLLGWEEPDIFAH